MSCVVESKLLRLYATGQVLSIVTFFFIPIEGWLHALWQVGVGWAGATFVLVGMRRFRPEGKLAWYALSGGVFLNAAGLLVEMIGVRFFHITSAPGPADLFWLSLFPGLIIALGTMVFRRSACEDPVALALNTLVCALVATTLAIVAWEFIVWQIHTDPHLSLGKRVIVTAYPLGDLIVLALVLRLVFAGGARNAAFALIVLALAFFLGADIGWAGLLRSGKTPGPVLRRLLEMASMGAFALVGAAALHPAVRRIGKAEDEVRPSTPTARWVALVVSITTAPLVMAAQALLDHWHAVSSF
jgi:hypothetical protein